MEQWVTSGQLITILLYQDCEMSGQRSDHQTAIHQMRSNMSWANQGCDVRACNCLGSLGTFCGIGPREVVIMSSSHSCGVACIIVLGIVQPYMKLKISSKNPELLYTS